MLCSSLRCRSARLSNQRWNTGDWKCHLLQYKSAIVSACLSRIVSACLIRRPYLSMNINLICIAGYFIRWGSYSWPLLFYCPWRNRNWMERGESYLEEFEVRSSNALRCIKHSAWSAFSVLFGSYLFLNLNRIHFVGKNLCTSGANSSAPPFFFPVGWLCELWPKLCFSQEIFAVTWCLLSRTSRSHILFVYDQDT